MKITIRKLVLGVLILNATPSAWGLCQDPRPLADQWNLLKRDRAREIMLYVREEGYFKGQINLPGTLQIYRSIALDYAHYSDWFWMAKQVKTLPDLSDGTPQFMIVRKLPVPQTVPAFPWNPVVRMEARVTPISADRQDFQSISSVFRTARLSHRNRLRGNAPTRRLISISGG